MRLFFFMDSDLFLFAFLIGYVRAVNFWTAYWPSKTTSSCMSCISGLLFLKSWLGNLISFIDGQTLEIEVLIIRSFVVYFIFKGPLC